MMSKGELIFRIKEFVWNILNSFCHIHKISRPNAWDVRAEIILQRAQKIFDAYHFEEYEVKKRAERFFRRCENRIEDIYRPYYRKREHLGEVLGKCRTHLEIDYQLMRMRFELHV